MDTAALALEVRQTIEPDITEAVRTSLLADEQFVEQLVEQAITSSAVEDLIVPHYDYQGEIDALSQTVQQRLAEQTVALSEAEIATLVESALNAQIPHIINQVLATLEVNKNYIMEIARAELSDLISEREIVDLYLENRAALVYDIVPLIVADMEALERGEEVPSKALAEEILAEKARAEAIRAEEARAKALAAEAAVVEAEEVAVEAIEVPAEPVEIAVETVEVAVEAVPFEEIDVAEVMAIPSVVEEVAAIPAAPTMPTPTVTPIVEEKPVLPKVPAPPAPATVSVTRVAVAEPMTAGIEISVIVEEAAPLVTTPITDEQAYEAERQRLRNAEIEKYQKIMGVINE
ncbi:MAG TPA: hypothetical protein VFC80_00090 [Sphaerochaeta sp.]|nr:hypothetical protein [Sphaerochaeta sp.]